MYHHLNQEERYQIDSESKAGVRVSEVARSLGRHRSTIYREPVRNRGQCGYRIKQAHKWLQERRGAVSGAPYSRVIADSCGGLTEDRLEP